MGLFRYIIKFLQSNLPEDDERRTNLTPMARNILYNVLKDLRALGIPEETISSCRFQIPTKKNNEKEYNFITQICEKHIKPLMVEGDKA